MQVSNQSTLVPAATLIVVRDAANGLEVLLLRRADSKTFAGGAWIFPGGKVDADDRHLHACSEGLDDATASARLNVPHNGLDYYLAAIRECFEEAGLLFVSSEPNTIKPHLDEWRLELRRGERNFQSLCSEYGLKLAADQLTYFSHWITPVGVPKRFDTRFFLAITPSGQIASADGTEVVEHLWISARDALAHDAPLKLMLPTRKCIETIARFDSASALMDWARAPREINVIVPRRAMGHDGLRHVMPNEPAWAEIGRLDPGGLGNVSCELQAGHAVRLSERVIRVTANNASVMTGPGTNSYLVGNGAANEWAVIDPGPLDSEHVNALLSAAPGVIRWIFVTHTHMDHSPAVALLKAKTHAQVYGQLPAFPERQDASLVPDAPLHGGERITLSDSTTLRIIHTPGHASNHLCYLLEEEKTLFTGDHVMQASTVVINPPDGDMRAYIAALRAVLSEDLDWLAPGHGFLMAQPHQAIEWIIAHRLQREAKVLAALRDLSPANAQQLLKQVYNDVPEALHRVALRSLTAHLIKLRDEGMATEANDQWSLTT
jgi:glyoxylase-like metal-dependent hydrolase (beta-lactamase superfamily II)/8-oxo-dGTP pyrophosphatase MutT (NUDIX family)